MSSPAFLSAALLNRVHDCLISCFKGAEGLRDETMLESALSRPASKFDYESSDIFALAAAYLFGLVRNTAYIDGNKRVALVAAYIFLTENGYRLETTDANLYLLVLGIATGEINEEGATRFLRDVCVPYHG
jgi:death on curing protein